MKNFAIFFGLLLGAVASGQSVPVIRTKLTPSADVLVGQPVRLDVEVLVPNYFTGAPVVPQFEMDGAIVTLSEDRPEHLNEQINGATFAGIRRFYLIYPEQSMDFRARTLDYFLPTSRLTLQQKWSGSVSHLRAGDSVSRTVVVTTEKMQAMLIPPMQFAAPDGVRIYPKGPTVEDQKSVNGVFTQGVRTEKASYLFTKPGDYILPEVAVTWWNLTTKKLTTSKLPATKIHVDENLAYVSELPPEQEPAVVASTPSRSWRRYTFIIVGLCIALVIVAVFVWVVRRWRGELLARYRAFASRQRESEAGYWHRFKNACNRNDASQSYALLLAWLRRVNASMTLDEFQRQAADPRLDQQIAILSRALFSSTGGVWDGRLFYDTVIAHRHIVRAGKRTMTRLPMLNPEP